MAATWGGSAPRRPGPRDGTGRAFGIGGENFGQDFDRDVAIQLRVVRAIHLTHASGAERSKDLVGAEANARGQCHR